MYLKILDVAALVGGDRDALHVLLQRGGHDFVDRAVVAEVDHLRARGLQDAAHDVDRGVVAVEQARRGDEAQPARVRGAGQVSRSDRSSRPLGVADGADGTDSQADAQYYHGARRPGSLQLHGLRRSTLIDAAGAGTPGSGTRSASCRSCPSLTELLCDLGLAPQLVGRTGFCIHPRETVRAIPKVGGTKTRRPGAPARARADARRRQYRREREADGRGDRALRAARGRHPSAPPPRTTSVLYRLLGGIFRHASRAEALSRSGSSEAWREAARACAALPARERALPHLEKAVDDRRARHLHLGHARRARLGHRAGNVGRDATRSCSSETAFADGARIVLLSERTVPLSQPRCRRASSAHAPPQVEGSPDRRRDGLVVRQPRDRRARLSRRLPPPACRGRGMTPYGGAEGSEGPSDSQVEDCAATLSSLVPHGGAGGWEGPSDSQEEDCPLPYSSFVPHGCGGMGRPLGFSGRGPSPCFIHLSLKCLPPSRCRCRWNTVCPASAPLLITTRNASSTPSWRAILPAASMQMAEQRLVLRPARRRAARSPSSGRQDVDRRLRMDVLEGEAQLVLVDDVRGDFARDDLAEYRRHGLSQSRFMIARYGPDVAEHDVRSQRAAILLRIVTCRRRP